MAMSGGQFSFGTGGAQNPVAITSASSGFSFGTTPTPALGGQVTSSTPALGGFSFATQTTATPAIASGFSFGTTPATSTSTATGFGLGGGALLAPASSASTGFSLGGSTIGTAPASSSGFALGTTPVSSSGFALGTTPAAASGFTLGTNPAASSGFPMGGGLGGTPSLGGTTPALSSSAFSFAATSQTPATKPAGFGFGMTSTAPLTSIAPVSSLGGVGLGVGGLGGGVLGGAGMGLGGAQPPSANASGPNSNGAKSDGKTAKEQLLPQDLFGTIAVFESWRNAENSASEDNIRQTAAPFHKVGKKAQEIQQLLAELSSEYLQLHGNAVSLKAEVMKEAEHVEMARRTKDTPMALQGENKAPEMYFINLVRNFEAEMIYSRNKIDEVAVCMQSANNPCETPEDIAEVLQREHETLKEMAAKVYAKHSQLVDLSQRLNTKTVVNDQVFFRPQSKEDAKTPASAVVRPVLGGSSSGLQAFQEQQQRAKAVTLGTAPPTMPLAQTSTPSLFGSNTGSNLFNNTSSFGLNTFNMGNSTPFGSKPLFSNPSSSGFGTSLNFGGSTSGIQSTTSPFSMSSPFNTKPFEEDSDSRRKRRL